MLRTLAAFAGLSFFLCLGLAAPAPANAGDGWDNPFCSGLVAVVPWDARGGTPSTSLSSDRYVLEVFANGKTDVAGVVTLITSDSAYSVPIARTDLLRSAGSDNFYAEPIFVAFDKPVDVHYAYVDQIGVDGAAPAVCPTVVQPVRASTRDASNESHVSIGADVKPVNATFLQALPALTCGRAYIPAELPRGAGAVVGAYGNVRKSTVIRIFIDSNGVPASASIERPSGIEGLDENVLGVVEHTRYSPARFLCTPVVSEMSIEMEYNP
ncbi:MAG TPA: energy transducer TonB [Candidatus Baltobacteraceae bacterium]|jgi:TonB family protein